MIFAKLFGVRPEDEDDPPTHPPVATAGHPRQTDVTGTHAALRTGSMPARPKAGPQSGAKPATTSFDPYNSGAFKKNNAWERVTRR